MILKIDVRYGTCDVKVKEKRKNPDGSVTYRGVSSSGACLVVGRGISFVISRLWGGLRMKMKFKATAIYCIVCQRRHFMPANMTEHTKYLVKEGWSKKKSWILTCPDCLKKEPGFKMKYKPEVYLNSGFYSDMDDEIVNQKEKLVKCRKPHKCPSCEKQIEKGDFALLETGFMDGRPVSNHTCLPCIDAWLEESGQVDVEDQESEGEQ